jgi:site-specific DNA recombinase
MADMILRGIGSRKIASTLNERGILTKSGKQWHDRVIRELLRRETLIGTFVWNQTATRGKRVISLPEDKWIRHPNHHEPILDEETFYAVQQALDARKTSGANKHVDNDRYLLSGILKCAHCGGPMVGRRWTQRPTKKTPNPKERWGYICSNYTKKGTCFYHWVYRDPIENAVIQQVKAFTLDFEAKPKIVRRKPTTTLRHELMNRLQSIERRYQRQIEAWEKELISDDDLRRARERIEKERQETEDALRKLDLEDERSSIVDLATKIKKLSPSLDSDDRLVVKNALRQIVAQIELQERKFAEIVWWAD